MLPSPDMWLLAAYGQPIPILLRCFVAASYNEIPLPSCGTKITYENGKLVIPDNPIIPFIEGDGTGRDIWKASVRVFDAAVEIAYNGKRRGAWYEVFAGEKAMDRFKTLREAAEPLDLVRVDRAVRRLPEDRLDHLLDLRRARLTADEDDGIDLLGLEAGQHEGVFARALGALDEV